METTRHFVATCYVVDDGATLLHEHEKLGMWLPPGGHVDRDELPHEAALRETYEETGLALGRTDVSEAARLYVFVDGDLAETDIRQFDRDNAVTVVYAVEDGSRELWTEATRYEN